MDSDSWTVRGAGGLSLWLLATSGAQAQEVVTRPFGGHACCSQTVEVWTDARRTNEPTCNRAERVLDAGCDGVCCFGHLFIGDVCPGIIGCPGDACPLEFDRPASECADTDGDGLLDSWETSGVDGVDLPGFGADPNLKDLFVELDYMAGAAPSQALVEEAKRMFCAAPADAGGSLNVGGGAGIRLWIDTGALTDITGRETPIQPCSCGDGVDNDADALADALDEDCLEYVAGAAEDGAGAGSCDDGLDNGSDGLRDRDDLDCLVFDGSHTESSARPRSCLDGLDNDADGAFDTSDSDCLVGDDLAGGNSLARSDLSGLSASFYGIKASNFSTTRERVFRYAVSAPDPRNAAGTSSGSNGPSTLVDTTQAWVSNEWTTRTLTITDGTGAGQARTITSNTATTLSVSAGWDTIPDATSRYSISLIGGQGEWGGDDFMVFATGLGLFPDDASSFVHELGHNLNLGHGGDVEANCKPNYVSIMNYDHASGIALANSQGGQDIDGNGSADGLVFDFSPARLALPAGLARGLAPLATLTESNLNEATFLDPGDPQHLLVYVDAMGRKVKSPTNGDRDGDGIADGVDFSGDGDTNDGAGLTVNIDTVGASGFPTACRNSSSASTLTGHDDWSRISLSFGQFGDAADAPVNPVLTPEPTATEKRALVRELSTTDLAARQSASLPVEVGAPLSYQLHADNQGPNPASFVELTLELSSQTPFLSASHRCEHTAGVVRCERRDLLARASHAAAVVVDTSGSCSDGLPAPLTSTVRVAHVAPLAGADPEPADDVNVLVVTPTDTTPPAITDLRVTPDRLWPPNHKFATVTVSATSSDLCDDSPDCALLQVTSSEAVDAPGSGNTAPDFRITSSHTAELRAERAGGGAGRTYTLRYECTDRSGNAAFADVEVRVPHAP